MKASDTVTQQPDRSHAHRYDSGKASAALAAQPAVAQAKFLHQKGKFQTWQLAERHLLGNTTLGYTPPIINSTVVHGNTNIPAVYSAIAQPVINTMPDGLAYAAEVTGVGTNHLGHYMYLPGLPPWTAESSKMTIAGVTGLHKKIDDLEGNSTLEVTGRNSSKQLRDQVEKHETVHALEIESANEEIFGSWDARLEAAKKQQRKFKGDSPADAVKAAYAYAGGSPQEVAEALHARWGHDSDHFHGQGNGKTIADQPRHNHDFSLMQSVYFLTI